MVMKILNIKGCKTCKQVLIFIDRCDSDDKVVIVAWHKHEESNLIQEAYAEFSSDNEFSDMERYVADYSQESANQFANSMKF